MSRRLIIIILAILIIGVIGGTVALVVNRLRANQTPSDPTNQGSLSEAPTGQQNIVDPTGDDDRDGLSNSDEAVWGTDRNNPDTDADGFQDGEEVAADHNPTIPSPNDKLPPGFVPGREQNPLDPASQQPVAVDQFFADNLNLKGTDRNLSNDYKSQYSENERSADTLKVFVAEQAIITQLPRPREELIQATASQGSVSEYVKIIEDLTPLSTPDRFRTAMADVLAGNPNSMAGMAWSVRLYQERLIEIAVPTTAQNMQRLLLGYTELLAATYDQIALYNEDPVKALVGVRQLEEIEKRYLPLIEQERNRLLALAEQ